MAISGLIPSLSCRMCCPHPQFATLVKLRPAERRWWWPVGTIGRGNLAGRCCQWPT